MKIKISLFISLILLMVSCEKNSSIDTPEPQLKIIEANVTFETQGGTGFVRLDARNAVTATSNAEWCTVSVDNTTVNIHVDAHTGMGGRAATITIRSGNETIDVTAVQTAAVMWFKNLTDNTISFLSEGSTIATPIISSYPIQVENKPDWITYRIENDSLFLTATPGVRKGSISFSSEGRSITYNIMQISYSGLLGTWKMKFNNPSNGNRLDSTLVRLEEKERNASFSMKNLYITGTNEAEIQVDFDPKTNNATISAGQYLMTATDGRLVYLALRSATGSYNYATSSQLAGILDIKDNGTVTYTFISNETWTAAAGFGFYLFTGEPSSTTTTGSSYKRFMNIVMTKI